MWHAWERREKRTRFWWEIPKERPLGTPKRRWEDGIRLDLREIGLGLWIGFDWLRIGTGGGGCCECGDEPSGSCAKESELCLNCSFLPYRFSDRNVVCIVSELQLSNFLSLLN
jgi:hypothetical protein